LIIAAIAVAASWMAYVQGERNVAALPRARASLLVAGMALLVAGGSLMRLLWIKDYTVSYVYANVGNDLPSIYVISAFWAGQEGTFLLWAMLAAVIGYAMTFFRAGDFEAPVMRIYLPSLMVLIVLTLLSSPFETLGQLAAGQVPADGAGLNPLLRDPWMAIHPPITFLGYAALAAPFAYAIASLRRSDNDGWVRHALPWALIGWLALGAGIIMGAFWAYKVLGWGGWWGWDPVENASLLPWLTATALFHGLLLQRTRRKWAKTNVLLAVVTFGLVIYATFLTRSGVLSDASVHSFGQDDVGFWGVGAWLFIVLGYSAWRLWSARGSYLKGEPVDEPLFSREVLIVVGMVVLAASAAAVMLGTSAPIVTQIAGQGAQAVDTSFYGRTTLPLGILIALGIGLSVLLRWKGTGSVSRNALLIAALFGAAGMVVAYLMGVDSLLFLLFAGSGVFALVANLIVFERALAQGGWRTAGGYMAHIGVAFMLVAIVAATTGRKERADLPFGTAVEVFGYQLTFTGWESLPEGKQATLIEMTRPGRQTSEVLKPRLYRMPWQGRIDTRAEPDIRRRLSGDLYVAPAQFLPPEEALAEQGELITLAKEESREVGGITYTFIEYEMDPHGAEANGGVAMPGGIGARVRVERDGQSEELVPIMTVGASGVSPHAANPMPYGWGGELRLQSINADEGTVTLLYSDGSVPEDGRAIGGILSVEVSEKPLMSLLWTGVILALLGGSLAAWRRVLQVKPA
ncbi:cytochrome c biogenesis protein CcsA, partial [Gemmatimonadota bacterium]